MATSTAFKAGCEGDIEKYLGSIKTDQDLEAKNKYDLAKQEYAKLNAYLRENAQALYDIFSQGLSEKEAKQTLNNLCAMFDPENVVTNKGLRVGCELDTAKIQKFFEQALNNGYFLDAKGQPVYDWTQSKDGQIIERDVKQAIIKGIVGHTKFNINALDVSDKQKRELNAKINQLAQSNELQGKKFEDLYKMVYTTSYVNDGLSDKGLAPSTYQRVSKDVKEKIGPVQKDENNRVVSTENAVDRGTRMAQSAVATLTPGHSLTQTQGRVYTPTQN